jgi:multiple sugar transport system substrate-binding protein
MKRLFSPIFLCALLAVWLSACKPTAAGPQPLKEKATLTFVVPYEQRDLYNPAIEKFRTREPNIGIEIKTQSYNDPMGDVRLVSWYEVNSAQSNPADVALDLTPFLQEDTSFQREDYFPGVLDSFTASGKLLALPTGMDPFVMLYNQDLFDRMGVAYPNSDWTWEDFRTKALQLTDAPAGIYGYLPADGYFDSFFFVYQNGGRIFERDRAARFDSPEVIGAVEWYANLFGENGAAPTSVQIRKAFGDGGGLLGISQGRVGMWIGSLSNIKGTDVIRWTFRVGVVPLPRGAEAFSVAQFQGLMIRKDTPNPQAAWRWVSFLSSQPMDWIYPARKSVADSPTFSTTFGKERAEAARAALQQSSLITGLDLAGLQSNLDTLNSAVIMVVEQGLPATEALQKAQQNAGGK